MATSRLVAMQTLLIALTLLLTSMVHASTSTSEITDMWINPTEDGWGVNITLQNDVAFLTFFVYDTSQNPTWYSSDAHYQGVRGDGALVWSGDLWATRGPWFGGGASTVQRRKVGTAAFALATLNQATLTYSVDGVQVIKSVQRQTWTLENYSGNYAGGYSIRRTGCNPSFLNGVEEQVGLLSVSHNGGSFAATINGSAICTFVGQYSQAGKLGGVSGNYSCGDGAQGSFTLFELTPTISGFTGRAIGGNQYCQWSGFFGGFRRAP